MLSFLCLDAYQNVQLPQPNLGVRVNELIDRPFLRKTAETIRLGTGIPQIFNDEVVVPAFLNRGVSLEDARDYARWSAAWSSLFQGAPTACMISPCLIC